LLQRGCSAAAVVCEARHHIARADTEYGMAAELERAREAEERAARRDR
jgi:hypothetical protein